MRNFETGATRDNDEGKIHYKGFLSPLALRAFGQYMERHRVQADGSLRAPDNWKKGMPMECYEDSLFRHVMEFMLLLECDGDPGDLDETAAAIFFNIQGWMHEREKEKLAAQRGDYMIPVNEEGTILRQSVDRSVLKLMLTDEDADLDPTDEYYAAQSEKRGDHFIARSSRSYHPDEERR